MRPLVLTPKFKRSFRKFTKNNAALQKRIEKTLLKMQSDVFDSGLGTHKLTGELKGLQSCSCGYDCRIIFRIEHNSDKNIEEIMLLDVGKHDEVY